MNTRKLRRVAVLLAAPFGAALACGGRTGDLLPGVTGEGAANGSGGAFGGKVPGFGNVPAATGGKPPVGKPPVGKPPVGKPPVMGSGGTIGRPIPTPASGGSVTFGGSAGFVAAGGVPGFECRFPSCNCGDCFANCECRMMGQFTDVCINQCGAGGTGAGGTGPTFCSAPSGQVVRVCTSANLGIPSCCTPSLECGLELPVTGMSTIPFAGGCQALNQPGRTEPGCPDLGTLFHGAPAPGSAEGCCRPDGTCGIDLSVLNLGCLQTRIGGSPIECPGVDAGPPPVPVDAALE